MDGCLGLIVFAVSLVLLIAPLISLVVSFQMRSRIRDLETELRTLRARFEARERREKRESESEATSVASAPPEPAAPPPFQPTETVTSETAIDETTAPAAFDAQLPGPTLPKLTMPEAPVAPDDETVRSIPVETTTEQPEDAEPAAPSVEGDLAEPSASPSPSESAVPPPPAVPPSIPPPAPAPRAAFDWENLVGVKLFSWIAGIALALAAVFFLKYSIDHGWLSPIIRLLSGIATGIGLIVLCEAKFAARYRVTANALDASGIAILYASLFAAHDMWNLVSQPVAFVLMVVVTALAVFLAVRRASAFIALLGLLGGFATPALLSTGQDRPFALFGYLLILNAGVAWVAWKKSWPVLSLLSLAFTTIYQWAWVVTFLDGPRVPVAIGVFLVFPIAAVMMIWIAKAKDPERSSSLFEWTAQAGAILPLLFAFYGAAIPAFGDRRAWLFFFLLVVDAGLALVALSKRMPGMLHLLGGASTVLVFAVWFGVSWTPEAWPSILGWLAAFVLLYALVPELARLRGVEMDVASMAARYAAPALLFAFPAMCALDDFEAEPRIALLFGVLFGLVAVLGTLAVRQDAKWLYIPASLFAVLAQGVWVVQHLRKENLTHALVVFGAFTALFVAVPMIAARFLKMLGASRGVALPLIGTLAVLLPFGDSRFADAAFVGAVAIIAAAVIGLQAMGGVVKRRFAIAIGVLLAWIVLGFFWAGIHLEASLTRALVAAGLVALVVTAGSAWWARTRAVASGDASIFTGLFVYIFMLVVAGIHELAAHAGPFLALLAFVTALFAIGSIYAKTPHAHLLSAAFTQFTLAVWCGTVHSWGQTLTAVVACVIAAFFAFGVWRFAGRIGARGSAEHASAVVASVLVGHFVPIVASMGDWNIDWPVLVMAHLALLVITFTATWKTGWHGVAIASVVPTAIAYGTFAEESAANPGAVVKLMFAALLYLPFVAYPLALGERAAKRITPYVAAIVASVPFFFFARDVLDQIDFAFMAMLPLAQAGLMAFLLVRLLGIEPEGERTMGRLALVAGALLAFVTVAIPLQLDKEWITIGWALEAAALVWLFRRIPHVGLLATSAGLFAVVFVRLVFNPAVFAYHDRSSVPILNWYLYTYLVPAAAFFALPYFLDAAGTWRRRLVISCSAAGTILLFLLLNIEIADFYSKGTSLTFDFDAGLAQDLTYTIGWALFAIGMLIAGLVKRLRAVRIASLALLVVAMAKCFLHDLMRLGGLYRVGSLVGLAISLAVVALLLQRFVLQTQDKERT